MSAERRALRYPLEAVRQREGWRLDALYAELGATSRRLVESAEQYEALCRQYRAVAEAAAPIARAVVDPVDARGRLAYLGLVQTRMASAAKARGELEVSVERLRIDSGKQRVKLESLERHRKDFERELAARVERAQSTEADRDWLARSQWRLHGASVTQPSAEDAGPARETGQ